MEIGTAVTEIKKGKIAYRVDKDGNLNISCGRVSFSEADLLDNLSALTEHIVKSRPASVKGIFIKNAVIHTTMGPAVHVTFAGRN
jgi:large subunit ribosomal protein L1